MNKGIQKVEFIGSFAKSKDLKSYALPEFCFWGRSNVGKSSLINYLCNRKEVARISSTPGKTQCFNLFLIDNSFLIMDLPGYGYAKVSRKKREFWNREIETYLNTRENLSLLFLLVDISIKPQKIDISKINLLGRNRIPFYIIYTKTDKCKKSEYTYNRSQMEHELSEYWNTLPPYIESSAEKSIGGKEILNVIESLINESKISKNN